MNVTIKTTEEQDKMRVAGRLAADVLDMIGEHVQPGVSTGDLDDICHQFITEIQDAIPAPLNYRGFPKSICTSVNHVVCHGIPGERTLKSGDAYLQLGLRRRETARRLQDGKHNYKNFKEFLHV